MKIPNHSTTAKTAIVSLARIVSEDSQPIGLKKSVMDKSSKDS